MFHNLHRDLLHGAHVIRPLIGLAWLGVFVVFAYIDAATGALSPWYGRQTGQPFAWHAEFFRVGVYTLLGIAFTMPPPFGKPHVQGIHAHKTASSSLYTGVLVTIEAIFLVWGLATSVPGVWVYLNSLGVSIELVVFLAFLDILFQVIEPGLALLAIAAFGSMGGTGSAGGASEEGAGGEEPEEVSEGGGSPVMEEA